MINVQYFRFTAPADLRLVVAGDLHGADPAPILKLIERQGPAAILLTGDILEGPGRQHLSLPFQKVLSWQEKYQIGMEFMKGCVQIAPTFFVSGNHENTLRTHAVEEIKSLGVTTLLDSDVEFEGIRLGGLGSSAAFGAGRLQPDVEFLKSFAEKDGFKVLLCHHPEYFDPYIRPLPIDLTVSGHAHGGQWRIGSLGVFAPGQGVFPKYTKGLYHNRLAVHTGLNNHVALVPRIFNPYDILCIELNKKCL